MMEACVGLRACAILDPDGGLLARSSEKDWAPGAAAIWSAAADRSRPAPTQVHVATEAGEVFAVRGTSGSVVAVADRFTLASLMLCDLRSALRRLEAAAS